MKKGTTTSAWRFILALCLIGMVIFTNASFRPITASAASGINQQLNFQGRLYTASGATVPDGYYNIQFKIYQDGAGTATGNPGGTLKWTEDWTNAGGHGVQVINGFISVQLGSIIPFAGSVDWNQDTLWLSMNVGNTNTTCTPFSACSGDGEMVPMKRLSSTPYALNAGMLGGRDASGFIQNTTTPQTANIALQSAAAGNVGMAVQGASSQSADLLQLRDSTGLVNAAFNSSGNQLTLGRIATSGTVTQGKLTLSDGTTDGFGLTLQSGTLTANRTITLPDSTSATDTVCLQTLANCGSAGATRALDNLTATAINQSLVPGSAYNNSLDLGSSSATWRSGYFGSVVYTPSIRPLSDSATALKIQNAAGTTDLITFDTTGAGTTTINGTTKITPQTSTSTTLLCSNSGILSTCDASVKTPTGTNFILNGTGLQSGANFNISGTGVANKLQATSFDTASAGALTVGDTNATSITVGKTTGTSPLTLSSSTVTLGIATSPTTLQAAAQTTAATQGATLTIQGATSGTTGTGGTLALQGGNSASGTTGGNLTLSGGTGSTSNGLVILGTSAFNTSAADANCFPGGTESGTTTGCTIAQSSVNNYASVLVGFTQDGQTATLPNPTVTTAGRVIYVTASGATKDFTLSVNGGGQGNQIAMRKNTTATMIWNGSAWTAAGASSSTTLQAAYDNTLQSAGGAELVVSKTNATNGLTIRDSSINPVNGTLLSVQSKSAAGLFQVNSNVTEYVSNAGAETAGASTTTFPASTWSAIGSSTVSRNTTSTDNSIATGQASVKVVSTTAAQDGVKNTLASALNTAQTYNVSFTTRLSSGTFTDMNVYYSVDGTTASVPCIATQAIATSIWTKVNCAFTAPSSGITASNAILIRQTAAGTARTFYVDNLSVTIAADYNYATDGSVTDGTNFATNWSAVAGSTVTRSTSVGNDASDSAQATTTATAGQGVRNKLAINPLSSTLYRVTVYVASSNTFNDFTVRYSRDGGTNFVTCADYNTQVISTNTTAFTKVTCYITTDATDATSPYVYFTQTSGTARTFYVDTFSMNLNTNTAPNVQVGGGINGGPTTLFTLDRGASAPVAANNDALLGSMYYDTTLGKLQCYEADGWGACGSSPDNIITISPEYTNAVLHGTGVGTMTSDLCSDYLNINDGSVGQPTICGANETYNFYKWTSPQNNNQMYSIYVTYQLPSTFKSFNSGQTSLMARTDNGSNGGAANVQMTIYRNSGTGLTPCGSATTISTGTVTSWQTKTASGAADPSTCGFGPSNSIVFQIDMTTNKNANAYVGNLNFAFSNK